MRSVMRLWALLVSCGLCSCATSSKLTSLVGKWKGTLEYADYQPPHKRVVLPTLLEVTAAGEGERVNFAYTYDDGPAKAVRSTEALAVEADGSLRWGEQRFAFTRTGQQLVAITEGRDDDAPATLRETFTFVEPRKFVLLKEVRPVGATNFMFRHQYVMERDNEGRGATVRSSPELAPAKRDNEGRGATVRSSPELAPAKRDNEGRGATVRSSPELAPGNPSP